MTFVFVEHARLTSHIKENVSTASFPALQKGTKACCAAEVILMYKKVLSYQTQAGFEVGKAEEV